MDQSQFKDIFVSETQDHLQKMNDNLLELEKNIKQNHKEKNSYLLDELMRSAHTIKSSSATMGYNKMAYFTHVLEDVFDYARNGMLEITQEIINQVFEALDQMEASLKSIIKNNVEKDLDKFSEKIKKMTGVATQGVGKSQRSESGKPAVSVEEKPIEEIEVEKISHIKVPVKRLDDLMDLTEELLIERMRLNSIESVKPELEHLNLLISNLQYQIMQSRLVPVGQIFARFPKMVRDTAQNLKKEIDFVMEGQDLEVDRTIIDKLAEPLVHLLRNAIDHGIDKKGIIKLTARREKDFVLIEVQNDGNGIDWKGVVSSAISKNLISSEAGQILIKRIKELPSQEWQKDVETLLFKGRLSTSVKVTETSGRGVGLSVVKKFVDEINGNFILQSPLPSGQTGAKFILELPLTLAIITALLVKVEDSIFAIPFSSIERVVSINYNSIKSMADQDVAVIDGTNIPLADLKKVFSLLGKELKKNLQKENYSVVLVNKNREKAGLVIDSLLGQQEIIVKPLPAVLKGVKGFAGSTILGTGQAILILDIVSMLQDSSKLVRK